MRLRPTCLLWAIVLIATHTAGAAAATSALQPAAPSALQQAQPTFGARADPAQGRAASKKPDPLSLKPSTGLAVKAEPALSTASAAAKGALSTKGGVARSAKNLFDMEDRAIIIVSGRQSTAGELKRKLHAAIADKNGPAKTVKGGARKLDLAALNVSRSSAGAAPLAQTTAAARHSTRAAKVALASQAPPTLSTYSQNTGPSRLNPASPVVSVNKSGTSAVLKDLVCADKGPPKITEVAGTLKAGGKAAVWGHCFGDRPGRVEVIGQFPGGKLTLPFTAWDMTSVDVTIPATIHGAADHAVAMTIVTADGKTTPAMQAKFVAARERVEVPDRLWSPKAGFELADTVEELNTNKAGAMRANPARSGQVAKSLRVNPQCALDNVDFTVLSGGVGQIRGWELGPANEAAVTIDWVGTCIRTETTTSYHYVIGFAGDDIAVTSACRVAFLARAWAYCPVGIAP